jgi:hypothetical protein
MFWFYLWFIALFISVIGIVIFTILAGNNGEEYEVYYKWLKFFVITTAVIVYAGVIALIIFAVATFIVSVIG